MSSGHLIFLTYVFGERAIRKSLSFSGCPITRRAEEMAGSAVFRQDTPINFNSFVLTGYLPPK